MIETEHPARVRDAVRALASLDRQVTAARAAMTDQVLRRYGLTWTGYRALAEAARHATTDHRQLADAVGLSASTLAGVVTGLCYVGLLRRDRQSARGGRVDIAVTEHGRAQLAAIDRDAEPLAARLLANLADLAEWNVVLPAASLSGHDPGE